RKYAPHLKQIRAHRDGTFWERLDMFPGALADPDGYVQYDSGGQFETDANLKIGQKVNMHEGLKRHPRYTLFVQK
ncbi:MAG: hypothetical protein ACREXY_16800, partial [Gammaproteobacteria bacterium]